MVCSKSGGLESILAGIEAALELERELGVRSFECDRSLLASPTPSAAPPTQSPAVKAPAASATATDADAGRPSEPVQPASASTGGEYDFVFLHDRKLSPAGAEMMNKITDALCKGSIRAPVVTEKPPPPARAYVVLGSFALKKFFPGLRGAPGQWLESDAGVKVLVSNSPEYILRFGRETEAVRKIKQEMWRSLKTVPQRLGIG
jgi:hypothetical protein